MCGCILENAKWQQVPGGFSLLCHSGLLPCFFLVGVSVCVCVFLVLCCGLGLMCFVLGALPFEGWCVFVRVVSPVLCCVLCPVSCVLCVGCGVLGLGSWVLGVLCWVLGFGCWVVGVDRARCAQVESVQDRP